MPFDFNAQVHTDSLGFLNTTFPATAVLEIRTGTRPGVANAATGTLLWSFTIAGGWAAASAGSRALASLPLTGNAVAAGTAGYFRLRNAGDTARIEGNITATGGGGDMTVDNTSITSGQSVSVTGFTITSTDDQA
jgi:hypothetical protein